MIRYRLNETRVEGWVGGHSININSENDVRQEIKRILEAIESIEGRGIYRVELYRWAFVRKRLFGAGFTAAYYRGLNIGYNYKNWFIVPRKENDYEYLEVQKAR